MKLRFEHNALRLRLRKSDLENLKQTQTIRETVAFPDSTLTYRLSIGIETPVVMASIAGSCIEITVPSDLATAWMNGQDIGIYQSIACSDGHTLQVSIEKDFPCKDRPGEDEADFFTAPTSTQNSAKC